jgi:hypothetical protein
MFNQRANMTWKWKLGCFVTRATLNWKALFLFLVDLFQRHKNEIFQTSNHIWNMFIMKI